MKNIQKIYFSCREQPNIRAGGPSGYLANLQAGFNKLQMPFPLITNATKRPKVLAKWLSCWCFVSKYRRRLRLLLFYFVFKPELTNAAQNILRSPNLKWVITESVEDFDVVYNFVRSESLPVKIALMSHCPERPSDEFKASAKKVRETLTPKQYEKLVRKYETKEADAFKNADLILFPSKGAMEPYFETWQEFPQIVREKEIYFLETGCAPLACEDFSREHVIEKFGLNANASLRICFIGRHEEVKGYDFLVNAAKSVWNRVPDAEFVIGGKASATIPPPDDARWKECGYVNPAELLKTADVFVLPNRRTYFDLVLLEVLSSGVPVIATKTGGNKDVAQVIENDGGKILLCEPSTESIAATILDFAKLSADARELLGKNLRASYQKNYTHQAFAQRYLQLFKKLTASRDVFPTIRSFSTKPSD